VLDIELAGQQRSDDACLRLRPVKRTDRDDWSGRRIEPAWRVCIGQPSGAPAIAGRSAEHQLTSSEHHDVATRRCLDYSLLACDHFGRGDIESGRSVRRCIAQRVLMWHPVAHPMRPDPLVSRRLPHQAAGFGELATQDFATQDFAAQNLANFRIATPGPTHWLWCRRW